MKQLAPLFVLGCLSLAGCDEKPVIAEASPAKSATPAASAAPSAPAAPERLSPEDTYAAFLAAITAKKPLSEITELMTKEEGEKIQKQIEGAKDPEKMLGLFYRMHDPVAEGHDPKVVSKEIKGDVATVAYTVKAPESDAFDKFVTLQLRDGRWRIESIELKSAK